MAITNYERVGKAMDLLKAGLAPFVEREFRNLYKDKAGERAGKFVTDDRLNTGKPLAEWDSAALLRLMWEAWNDVFRRTLGQAERTLVSELRDVRNRWAHQQTFSSDDTDLSLIHISEPTRLLSISYAVFCLKKKIRQQLTIASATYQLH